MSPKQILLGVITGVHGIRGELVVKSFAAEPEDIAAYGPLSDKSGSRAFKLKVIRVTPKGGVIVRVDGVADRNAAEALKGTELYIDRGKLPPASGDEYYHADLIGLDAVSPDGRPIGLITGIHNYGAGDLIEIRLANSTASELVAFTDTFVPTVDIAARRITVVMPVAAAEDDD